MKLEKYSIGIGDRFGRQGKAQLSALMETRGLGIEVVGVWNKSFREHSIIGTTPAAIPQVATLGQTAGWTARALAGGDYAVTLRRTTPGRVILLTTNGNSGPSVALTSPP